MSSIDKTPSGGTEGVAPTQNTTTQRKGPARATCGNCGKNHLVARLENGICRGCRVEAGHLAMRAYQYRLRPTPEQEQQLLRAAKMSAIWWNHLVWPMVEVEDRVRARAFAALDALKVERGAPADPKTPEERKAAREANKLITPEERDAAWTAAREAEGNWWESRPSGSLKEHLSRIRERLPWWGLPVNLSNAVYQRVGQLRKAPRLKSVRRGDLGELTLPGPNNGGRPPRLEQGADGVQRWYLDLPNSKPTKRTAPEDIAVLGPVELVMHRPLPAGARYCSTSIAKHPDGWYASLVYEVPPDKTVEPKVGEVRHLVVGVDRGSADELATWSRPLSVPKQRPALEGHQWGPYGVGALPATEAEQRAETEAAAYDRRLARMYKRQGVKPGKALTQAVAKHKWGRRDEAPPSKRHQERHARRARTQARATRQRREVRVIAAQQLARQARIIVLEELQTKSMTAKKQDAGAGGRGLNRQVRRQGWYDFELRVRAAAEKTGSVVVVVPPQHTSSVCHQCGAAVERPERATVVCPVHGAMPADANAARNIEQRGAALLALGSPGSERLSAAEKAHLARTAPDHATAWARAYLARQRAAAEGASKPRSKSRRKPK